MVRPYERVNLAIDWSKRVNLTNLESILLPQYCIGLALLIALIRSSIKDGCKFRRHDLNTSTRCADFTSLVFIYFSADALKRHAFNSNYVSHILVML